MPHRTSKTAQTPMPSPVERSVSPTAVEDASRYEWRIDGASRTGQARSENQDACRMVRGSDNRAALILCDGAGGVAGGKLAAETAAQALADAIERTLKSTEPADWPTTFEQAVAEARQSVKAEAEAGITTAIIAVLENNLLHFATLGDGALVTVWPDGMTQEVLVPHHVLGEQTNIIAGFIGHDCMVPPRIGSIRLEPGSFVIAMSDGAGDLFPRESFAASGDAYRAEIASADGGIADKLLEQLEAARDPDTGAYLHSDNLTLLIGLLTNAEPGNG